MTSTQTPTVPSGYDEAHAAGWTYHRNGVSGCDFYAKVEDGALRVAWCVMTPTEDDWDESYPVAASVPLPVLAGLAKLPAVGETFDVNIRRTPTQVRHVVEVADGRPVMHVFDIAEVEPAPTLSGRCLVVSDLIDGEDKRVAAFALDEILEGNATRTLRGDCLYDVAVPLAKAAKEQAR